MRHLAITAALALGIGLVGPTAAGAEDTDEPSEHSENISHVKNLEYEALALPGTPSSAGENEGSDIEFARLGGRELAFAGTIRNGMQIVDIRKPERARIVGVYECGVTQGDIQIFRQDDEPGKLFATYTADATGNASSTCYREAEALGFDAVNENGTGRLGSFIVDVSNPRKPRTVSFLDIPQGSHNTTVHPSGDFLYNSNSDLINSPLPAIEIFDISDPSNPVELDELPIPTRPGLGTESHDITFNEAGTRAYSAAISQGVIINTEDPANPSVITSIFDPIVNVWHQSDPYTLTDPDGNERTFLVAEDEFIGALPFPVCPSGSFHIWDITGEKEENPEKVGIWNIDDVGPTSGALDTCTAHVFRIHPDEQIMTVAFYNGGVRVVDVSALEGVSLGETDIVGEGMKELASFRFTGDRASNTWAAKTPEIDPVTGGFFLYANDLERGLDIFEFEGTASDE